MNKKIVIFIIIFIYVFSFVACFKKDKNDNLGVIINIKVPDSQVYATYLTNKTIQFTAEVKTLKGKEISETLVWEADKGAMSLNGEYKTPTEAPQTVTISARLGEVVSSINIRIVKEFPTKTNRYYFYSDEVVSDLMFNTLNPGNSNGGFLGKIADDSTINMIDTYDFVYEGKKALKIIANSSIENGIFFQFGYDGSQSPVAVETDMSNYNTLNFAIKSDNVSEIIAIILANNVIQTQTISIGKDWTLKTIPISLTSASMQKFTKIIFKTSLATPIDGVIYLDNVYFSKE
jgi:hypothetical protein